MSEQPKNQQPAAAPIDAPALSENELSAILSASLNSYMTTAERDCLRNLMRRVKAANPIVQPAPAPAPSPADELAAFEVVLDDAQEARLVGWVGAEKWTPWQRSVARLALLLNTTNRGLIDYEAAQHFARELMERTARASSANETDDYETRRKVAEALGIVWPGTRDGKRIGYAWSYLLGCIKDAAANETGAEGADALAHEVWSAAQRAPGEGIEDAVQRIAAILSRSPAMAAEAVAIPAGWKAMPPSATTAMRMAMAKAAADYMQRTGGNSPDAIYEAAFAAAPQPAQADARVGLTDEQILECATRRVPPREVPKIPELAFSRSQFVDVVRALLASQPGQPEPRAEVTDDQIAAMFERVTGYSIENGRAALNDADILGFARELLEAARTGASS